MPDSASDHGDFTRRDFFMALAASGAAASASALPLAADAQPSPAAAGSITEGTIAEAEKLAGIAFTATERAQIAKTVGEHLELFAARAKFGALDNQLAPAQVFRVLLPGEQPRTRSNALIEKFQRRGKAAPETDADLDWATVEELSAWIKDRKVTSARLVARAIARLKKSNAKLTNVITLIEAQAYREADERDAEVKRGKIRGPLHGIPYGLKDIFDTAGIATTWGAEPWRDRVPSRDAGVVERLREAGAVCVAKTAVGALAYGDIWFGGTCKNPWNPEQGSSGSSAGSASVVASGCVPFAIGTETLGSIISPSVRCGTTGLRPTFGRVPRDGAMALCWSWDKIGPIARSVGDVGLVLEAIAGGSELDPSCVPDATVPRFSAPTGNATDAAGLRLGYDPAWFDGPSSPLRVALEAARAAGMTLVERSIAPPCDPSILLVSLMSEAAAAFEDLTRSGADDTLAWQDDDAWPNSFRRSWFLPAIELVQAERVRRRMMTWMREALGGGDGVDALVMPPFAGGMLTVTNATGHPALVLRARDPHRGEGGAAPGPTTVALVGRPFDEATLVTAGSALEAQLGVAGIRPSMAWS